MLVLLSPSKTQTPSFTSLKTDYSTPRFLPQIQELVQACQSLKASDIAILMHLSDNLAQLNFARFQSFQKTFTEKNASPSLFTFQGDVYTDIKAVEYSEKELKFANQHLRIISGLYGLLKPLDLMQPYRLEMKTKLKTKHSSNLYQFWDSQITNLINQDLVESNSKFVLNLASDEYFKAIQPQNLKATLIKVDFKQLKNSDYKIVPIYAKKARGTMANFIVKNQITSPQKLQNFNLDNYQFSSKLSTETHFIFTRD